MTTPRLTPRELEVLRALCESTAPQKYVAEALHISEETMKTYITKLGEKTGGESRIHLMHWAWKNGVAPCPCGKGAERGTVASSVEALHRASAEIAACAEFLESLDRGTAK